MRKTDGLTTELATFAERRSRSVYVARRFAPYFAQSVLDVGCYEAPLRELLSGARYVGVDIAGKPDIVVNLDTMAPLPFADRSFQSVICIEVLEHLDNLHHVFGELARVSDAHVIVSLPNCWRDARRPVERGHGHFAHYGLPADAPVDRHKWFFSYVEARDFIVAQAGRHGLEIVEMFGTEQHRAPWVRAARRIRYPGERYFNRYVQTIWAVMSKPALR
ncbi:MAG: methyltransferase domain-containing protein [Usitatibacter sp.]